MTPKQQRTHLKFWEIAEEWSEESGGLPRDKTLQMLIAAFWIRKFEDASGKSCLTLDLMEAGDNSINRRLMLGVLRHDPVLSRLKIREGAFIPDVYYLAAQNKRLGAPLWDGIESWDQFTPSPWESERDKVPWKALAELGLEHYMPDRLDIWFKEFSIPKGDFRRWCCDRKTDLPTFWFSKAERGQKKNIGRPTLSEHIKTAYAGLKAAGEIYYSDTKVRACEQIRKKVQENLDKADSSGLGDEAIRLAITPDFENEKEIADRQQVARKVAETLRE